MGTDGTALLTLAILLAARTCSSAHLRQTHLGVLLLRLICQNNSRLGEHFLHWDQLAGVLWKPGQLATCPVYNDALRVHTLILASRVPSVQATETCVQQLHCRCPSEPPPHLIYCIR